MDKKEVEKLLDDLYSSIYIEHCICTCADMEYELYEGVVLDDVKAEFDKVKNNLN